MCVHECESINSTMCKLSEPVYPISTETHTHTHPHTHIHTGHFCEPGVGVLRGVSSPLRFIDRVIDLGLFPPYLGAMGIQDFRLRGIIKQQCCVSCAICFQLCVCVCVWSPC